MSNSQNPEAAELSIPSASEGRSVWLRVSAVLDGTGTKPLCNIDVVYNHDSIQFVGNNPPPDFLNSGQCRPDLVLPGYTLLPGLTDAHAHLFLEGGELSSTKRAAYQAQSSDLLLQFARLRLEPLVRLGIIAVRDAGDKDKVGLSLSKLYRREQRPLMPYVESPGAAIHRRGQYGGFMAEPLENSASPRACVEARVREGADRIKLIATGIINFKLGRVSAKPQFTAEEILEFIAATKENGRQTFAHASGDDGIDLVLDGGVDSIEHGYFVRTDQLAKMRDRQIAWVPTFAPLQKQVDHASELGWGPDVVSKLRRILDQHAASLLRAHQMGVPIVAGSDAGSCGVAHGQGLFYELEIMERIGLPALAVVNAATGTGSTLLGYREPFGKIKPGYKSRFILTRHSPLTGVSNLRKERYVILDGQCYGADEDGITSGM
jgi:imidazolonepropionase-like amidohydrolase